MGDFYFEQNAYGDVNFDYNSNGRELRWMYLLSRMCCSEIITIHKLLSKPSEREKSRILLPKANAI